LHPSLKLLPTTPALAARKPSQNQQTPALLAPASACTQQHAALQCEVLHETKKGIHCHGELKILLVSSPTKLNHNTALFLLLTASQPHLTANAHTPQQTVLPAAFHSISRGRWVLNYGFLSNLMMMMQSNVGPISRCSLTSCSRPRCLSSISITTHTKRPDLVHHNILGPFQQQQQQQQQLRAHLLQLPQVPQHNKSHPYWQSTLMAKSQSHQH
jgi:hypothetical protein